MMELFSEVFQKQPCTSLSFSQDSTQTENIPANISSETSGLTWRHVKSGRAHCALLIFSFMLLRVVSILCMKRKKLCPKGSYNRLLIFQRLLFFFPEFSNTEKWANSFTSKKNRPKEFVKGSNLLECLLSAQFRRKGVGKELIGRCIASLYNAL